MSPVLFKFLELTILSKTMKEFSTFLRSINLEEILAKIVDKKYLSKYTYSHYEIYEFYIEKRISEMYKQFEEIKK